MCLRMVRLDESVREASVPFRLSAREAGDASLRKFAGEESFRLGWGGRGDNSLFRDSEKTSDGVSISGVKLLCEGPALGGKAGRDLSTFGTVVEDGGFFDFLRRRAIKDSWQDMQKMPCDVLA